MGKLIPQNFTAYSLKWMPEKIETTSTSEVSWSTYPDWTNILQLDFECESKMLCIILAHSKIGIERDVGGYAAQVNVKLTLDDGDVSATLGSVGKKDLAEGEALYGTYAVHTVAIVEKGSHSLKILMRPNAPNSTAYGYDRQLVILKGFYQGGTT